MPTGTHDPLFGPGPTPDRATLLAYVRGKLTGARAHEVERAMEADPLLREAVEGLRLPGAMAALDRLPGRPGGTPWGTYLLLGAVILAGMAVLLVLLPSEPGPSPPAQEVAQPTLDLKAAVGPDTGITADQFDRMVEEAVEIPLAQRIGHEPREARPSAAAEVPVLREDPPDRVDPLPRPGSLETIPSPVPGGGPRTSRKLLFLHDLKLVSPDELYPDEPQLTVEPGGLDARFARPEDRTSDLEPQRFQRYVPYMDAALGAFASGDHKRALADLRFLLRQYPDDVNALFYAGLCCYNLGLYARAEGYLSRAAVHPVDTFDEEASWYHAMAVSHRSPDEARSMLQTIANGGGFYASRARKRLDQMP